MNLFLEENICKSVSNLIQLKSDHSSLQSYDFESSTQMAESHLLDGYNNKKNVNNNHKSSMKSDSDTGQMIVPQEERNKQNDFCFCKFVTSVSCNAKKPF